MKEAAHSHSEEHHSSAEVLLPGITLCVAQINFYKILYRLRHSYVDTIPIEQ